jgi:chromosome partitioning protein
MLVYAISLEKGGVGKTSIAVNLAAAFAQAGLRTLLIDLDGQAHATQHLGVDPRSLEPRQSFLSVLRGRPLAELVTTTKDGVDLIPAVKAVSTELPVRLLSAPNNGLFVLKKALAQLAATSPYDTVIIDMPPARNAVLGMTLAAASRVIAPVQPEDLVLQSLPDLITSATEARELNPALNVSLVKNRYAVRGTLDTAYAEALQEHFGDLLLNITIPNRAAIRHAPGSGGSIFLYAGPDVSEARGLFIDLAAELLERDSPAEEA